LSESCFKVSTSFELGLERPKHAAPISERLIGFEADWIAAKQALLNSESILFFQIEEGHWRGDS
jgi:hypothetical protein